MTEIEMMSISEECTDDELMDYVKQVLKLGPSRENRLPTDST